MSKIAIGGSILVVLLGMLIIPGVVLADVCLMAYPTSPCEYHYSALDKCTGDDVGSGQVAVSLTPPMVARLPAARALRATRRRRRTVPLLGPANSM
jgi:hypothetical protein